MTMAERMRSKLQATFAPAELEIIDESEQHRGHGGWREGGETHFRIRMVAASLDGLSRVERHRAVNRTVAQELEDGVHALALDLRGAAGA